MYTLTHILTGKSKQIDENQISTVLVNLFGGGFTASMTKNALVALHKLGDGEIVKHNGYEVRKNDPRTT